MRCGIQLTILCAILFAGPIAASKIFYTTWNADHNIFNSSLVYLDLVTGQQRIFFSQVAAVYLSAYNSKLDLFHTYGNYGPYPSNITTIDGQGNLISSVPTVANLQCLKYSVSQNTLLGALISSTDNKMTLVTVDYTTGRVRERVSVPALDGDVIRSCDIDDATSRLVVHRKTKNNAFSESQLMIMDYQANVVVGQYDVVFNNTHSPNTYLANVAFSNSQLACIVGTSTATSFVQLGQFNFNSASGEVTPVIISETPLISWVVGLAWNPATSMFFYTAAMDPKETPVHWYIDTIDQNGARVGHTRVLNYRLMQARDPFVVVD